jgi:hypothetical protein
MSQEVIRWLVAGALFVHGAGHSLGFWMPARCWLVPGANEKALRRLSSIFWTLSIVGFVAASLSYLGILLPAAWFTAIVLVSASISLLGLVLFFGNWPAFNTVGALAMNIFVIFAVVITQFS